MTWSTTRQWILGLTTVEGYRSVKVRRDSRKRSQPILASIDDHFLLPLEKVRYKSEYIGRTEFFGSSPLHSATFSAATAFKEVSTHVATPHDRRMAQLSFITTMPTMIFQHCDETQKLKLNYSINLKGAKSSW
jgi:hypothetical protein